MAKATHTGTCQCCGSTQKLPNGKLSKHGYTVQHGWFEGTCMGSGHLPFEQSKDLVEQFIAAALKKKGQLLAEIVETRASTDSDLVWVQLYRPSTWGMKGGYFWTKRKLAAGRSKFHYSFERTESDKEHKIRACELSLDYAMDNPTLEDAVRKANESHIKSVLLPAVRQCESYIRWQQDRLENWQPAELTPIK
jgi:hypothetical protein